jgi:predicted CXXCH cytochrome family protein
MARDTGQFHISFAESSAAPAVLEKDGIFIGRLDTCEVVLDDKAVSRIHAGINFRESKYFLVNLSSSNILTLNGRPLGPQQSDVLADGDVIQIGPFTIAVARNKDAIALSVQQTAGHTQPTSPSTTAKQPGASASGSALKAFWEKRRREKEDWGTRLRPTEKPRPGKAMYNWRPTRDLRRPWRAGLFIWTFLIIGAIGAYAFFKFPGVYAPEPLSSSHALNFEGTTIAVASNGNSCTTCHTPNEPVESSCIRCHQAEGFHASNTKAHEEAGITCTVCHEEHKGANFQMKAAAIESCAGCHNDSNTKTYNGKSVRTAHEGSYGYPITDGKWTWQGVYREVSNAIPEINSSATGDKDEHARLNRQFHTIHVGRLKVPAGLNSDSRGLVSCSTCHSGYKPIDRTTPRETCAACHTNQGSTENRDARFAGSSVNCISCHVQHPYSSGRWSEFVTEDALERRKNAIAERIRMLSGQ